MIIMDMYEVSKLLEEKRISIYDIPLNVTYYARISTDREQQETSLAHQIEFYENKIKSNPNWNYIAGYYDEGISGSSITKRDAFLKMMDDGKQHKFDLIITKEISRFSRDTLDSIQCTRELLKYNVGVFFENDNINTLYKDSELRLTIMASMAQDELRRLSSRVKFGHAQSIKKGVVLGNSRIFGYNKDKGKLVIVEKEAEMIKKIFDLFVDGNSLNEISRILYQQGYRNREGNKIWRETIGGIICNPKYKGFYCGNKVKVLDYRTKAQKFLPQKDWIMYKDETGKIVPQIVDEDIWNLANKIYSEKSEIVKSHKTSIKNNAYTNLIWCGIHNVPFWKNSYTNNHKEKIYQWICSYKKTNGTKTCETFVLQESEIDSIVKDTIQYMNNYGDDFIDEYIELYKKSTQSNTYQKQVESIQSQIKSLQLKKDKLLDLSLDGAITNSEFKKRNDAFNQDIENYQNQIIELENNIKQQDDNLQSLKALRKKYQDNTLMLDTTDSIQRCAKDFISKIIVYPDTKNQATLKIIPKYGEPLKCCYTNDNRSSVHIFLKMITERKQLTRINRHANNHQDTYYITTYICI